jgi:hypothetical protein
MNRRVAAVAAVLTMAAGISVAAAQSGNWDFRQLRPGPVVADRGDVFSLKARFSVTPSRGGLTIAGRSHGSGGACLIGDLAQFGAPEQSCTSHSQCNQAWAAYHQANLGNPDYDAARFGAVGNGYCVSNRCWYRPGAQACVRRPSPNSWEIGTHEFPVDVGHVGQLYGYENRVEWQVLTCMNRAQPGGGDDTACAQSNGIYLPPAS